MHHCVVVPHDVSKSEDQCKIECNDDDFQCYFVEKNSKFVVDIEYPDEADWLIGGKDTK